VTAVELTVSPALSPALWAGLVTHRHDKDIAEPDAFCAKVEVLIDPSSSNPVAQGTMFQAILATGASPMDGTREERA
jgi:hypothetical protein